ncbi:MAG: hypothetical protein QXT25_02525 [Candidatus Anstonellaceae archaeon]
MKEIEEGFTKTLAMLLGRRLTGIRQYEEWLFRHVKGKVQKKRSRISNEIVYLPSVDFYNALGHNIVTLAESVELGKKCKLSENEIKTLTLSNASRVLSGIKTTTPEIIYSENIDTHESSNYGPTQHCYKVTFTWFSKFMACGFWGRTSEHVYGYANVVNCTFCVKCYSSTKLTRCFEMNDSNNCSDCYFCHNCENVRDSMFCFNTKGKRYAIGNIEVGREAYMKIKKLLQKQIADELEKKKSLRYDIYNIGKRAESV